uniref:Uncharacterized protein n=1 Tax=Mycena chlorophos TaxID=658473 RepID=A0ABQ0M5C0_MYCCL|nr:predicted protein [Mycena chlorophos]
MSGMLGRRISRASLSSDPFGHGTCTTSTPAYKPTEECVGVGWAPLSRTCIPVPRTFGRKIQGDSSGSHTSESDPRWQRCRQLRPAPGDVEPT